MYATRSGLAESFTTLAECNRQGWLWRDQVTHQRRWPEQDGRIVQQVFQDEQQRLIPLSFHPFNTERIETVCSIAARLLAANLQR